MPEKNSSYVKIPATGVIFYSLLLALLSFFAGYSFFKTKAGVSTPTATLTSASSTFAATKNDKPELKFFVMSFCPYGNQMEDVLRPVFDLLGSKADLTPHYILSKVTDLPNTCKSQSGDPSQCQTYLDNISKSGNAANAPFTTIDGCKKYLSDLYNKCMDEKNYLKSSDGTLYTSLHGRQEANQDVRELCAWNQVGNNKKAWWDFIGAVNKNCTAQNADSCWEDQAKSAGLDTNKITECFNNDGMKLIEQEIALTDKYQVQGSPTVMVNDAIFPPDAAYTQDGKGSLKIGDKVATQDQYRTPNVIKTAICASFKKAPGECNTQLKDLTGAAPAAGGCGN